MANASCLISESVLATINSTGTMFDGNRRVLLLLQVSLSKLLCI